MSNIYGHLEKKTSKNKKYISTINYWLFSPLYSIFLGPSRVYILQKNIHIMWYTDTHEKYIYFIHSHDNTQILLHFF